MMGAIRWIRFNVRFLFALFAITSVVLARISYLEHKCQTVLQEIERCGGYVESQPILGLACLRASSVTHVYIPHARTQDLDLESLRELPRLKTLTLLDYRMIWGSMMLTQDSRTLHMDQFSDKSLNSVRPKKLDAEAKRTFDSVSPDGPEQLHYDI